MKTSTRSSVERRRWLTGRLLVLVGLSMILAGGAAVMASAATTSKRGAPTAYQLSLRSKVDTSAGAPRPGRDPAAQKQTTLQQAAHQAVGNGTRADKVAKNLTKDHAKDVTPGQVISNPKTSHMLSNGCAVGYGDPGAQCLPAKGPDDTQETCMDARQIFPDGVKVTGTDWLKLDTDKNGVACDAGDAM